MSRLHDHYSRKWAMIPETIGKNKILGRTGISNSLTAAAHGVGKHQSTVEINTNDYIKTVADISDRGADVASCL